MSKSKENDEVAQEKLVILTKFLKEAPFDRWSESNLNKAAKACGFEEAYVLLLFPNGIEDLTKFFYERMNEQMNKNFDPNLYTKTNEKIAYLIGLKLKLYQPIREAIRSLLHYNLMPQNICRAQQSVCQSCDQIWYLAGDRSTDYNYYTKRALLEAVYSSSLLYWLADDSENYSATEEFIKRKIADVGKIGKFKASILKFFKGV